MLLQDVDFVQRSLFVAVLLLQTMRRVSGEHCYERQRSNPRQDLKDDI